MVTVFLIIFSLFNFIVITLSETHDCSLADKTSSKGSDLHLDLFNFEDPSAQQSRYVLTSPRSLEVIIRLFNIMIIYSV